MTNLYELSTELATINNDLVDSDGEISEALEARLDAAQLGFHAKVEGIAKWMLDIEGVEGAIDGEIARLQRKAKCAAALRERLKAYVKESMERAGVQKVESATVTLRIQKNPPSVDVLDEKKLPGRFVTVVQTIKVDKGAVLTALKSGEDVPGAVLVSDKTHLRIK